MTPPAPVRSPEPALLGPPNILVVDDDPSVRSLLSVWLKGEGCRLTIVEDAATAETALRNQEFDLLLCDINLPDRDGLDLVETLAGQNRGLPVIFLTGEPTVASAARSVRLRVVAYLVKPPDFGELRRLMSAAVADYRQRRALAASRSQLQEWDRDLARVEQLLQAAPSNSTAAPRLDYFQLTVHHVARALLDLERAFAPLIATDATRDPLVKLDLVQAVRHTVAVLESTRSHFKSKELGDLRKELEDLLTRLDQRRDVTEKPPPPDRSR